MSPGEALRAGLAWLDMAVDDRCWPEAVSAGNSALDARYLIVGAQLLRSGKETWLRTGSEVAARTALAAARAGSPVAAVTALERGRALLLSEAVPHWAALESVRPDLVARHDVAALAFAAVVRDADRRAVAPGAAPPGGAR